MKLFACAAALPLVSVIALASGSVDGGWKGHIGSGDNATDIMMSLHTEETSLSGSIYGPAGETSIDSGTVEGTTLRFKTTQRDYAAGTALTLDCIGSLVDDSISVSCTTEEDTPQTQEFTVARQAVLNP